MENQFKVINSLYTELMDKYDEIIAKLKKYLADGKERKLAFRKGDRGIVFTYLQRDEMPRTVLLGKIRYNDENEFIEVFDELYKEWINIYELKMNTYDVISNIQWENERKQTI